VRTPWAVVAGFVVGACAGAAIVLLLRTGGASGPEAAVPSLPVPTVAPDRKEPPSHLPRSAAPAPAVSPPEDPVAVAPAPPPAPAPRVDAKDMSLEAILRRLEDLALAGPHSPGPNAQELALHLKQRFRDARLRPGLYEALRVRVDCEGLEGFLPDGELLVRVRTVATEMRGGIPAGKVKDAEFSRLTQSLAARGELKGPLTEEFAVHPDPRVRRSAAVFAQWPPERPDILRNLARDPDPAVRSSAYQMIEALLNDGTFPGRDFEEVVFAGLEDLSAEVRGFAQDTLRYLGAKGAEEAVRVLRSGRHREAENSPEDLVRAALVGAPASLLAEPLSAHLAVDICSGCRSLSEEQPDLIRILVPHARRLLSGLAPGSREEARPLLTELVRIGETGVVREVVRAPEYSGTIRCEAVKALLEWSPPVEWEAAASQWFCDSGVAVGIRWDFLRDCNRDGPARDHDDPTRAEVAAAWKRVLGAVASGADDPGLASEAERILATVAQR